MARSRYWIGWSAALLALAVVFKWLTGVTEKVSHSTTQTIPSVTRTDPLPEWSEAVNRARNLVRTGLAGQKSPGLSVAVGVDGSIVWAEGFGWADLEARSPVTPNTRFRIGTASAALTSAAIGLMFEKGGLRLDDDIQAYVPQFPKTQWPVTLRQVMAHTGGLGTDDGYEDGSLSHQRCERPIEAVSHFANNGLLFEPGTQYKHSNYGWVLASAAVEAAADQPFLTFMGERIFRPLQMDNTGAESAKEENPEGIGEPGEDAPIFTFVHQVILRPLGMGDASVRPTTSPATLYLPGFGPHPLVGYGLHVMAPRNLSCYAGSMAFFSTPSDLVRFGLAIHSGTLLRPDTVRLLQTSQLLKSGKETTHGLGWDLQTVTLSGEHKQAAASLGELQGQKLGALMLFRDAGIVVALFSNMDYTDPSALAVRVAEAFAQRSGRMY